VFIASFIAYRIVLLEKLKNKAQVELQIIGFHDSAKHSCLTVDYFRQRSEFAHSCEKKKPQHAPKEAINSKRCLILIFSKKINDYLRTRGLGDQKFIIRRCRFGPLRAQVRRQDLFALMAEKEFSFLMPKLLLLNEAYTLAEPYPPRAFENVRDFPN